MEGFKPAVIDKLFMPNILRILDLERAVQVASAARAALDNGVCVAVIYRSLTSDANKTHRMLMGKRADYTKYRA